MGTKWKWGFIVAALATYAFATTGEAPSALQGPMPPPAATTNQEAFNLAMAPVRTERKVPVVAVLALNEGTETTDFLVPHAVLQRAGIATVEAVAPRSGRVALMPALEVEVARDLASFDATYPQGADYVLVPAMHTDNDPAILAWLRAQAHKGARIIGVCSGALVLGQAGLLDGRQFTGHWYDRSTLVQRHPTASYVPHQRYLADQNVVTTTGIIASLPVSLALVEAIAGRARAQALASELGVDDWSAQHDSAPFRLSAQAIGTIAWNSALFWRHEQRVIPVHEGMDDIALALTADTWSRTYRSTAVAITATGAPLLLRSGLRLHPAARQNPGDKLTEIPPQLPPACHLDTALQAIGQRYGGATRDWVATEIEYLPPATPSGVCRVGG